MRTSPTPSTTRDRAAADLIWSVRLGTAFSSNRISRLVIRDVSGMSSESWSRESWAGTRPRTVCRRPSAAVAELAVLVIFRMGALVVTSPRATSHP